MIGFGSSGPSIPSTGSTFNPNAGVISDDLLGTNNPVIGGQSQDFGK
jgi:hypothetical protein